MANNSDREIERKYLLRELPARAVGAPSLEIDQGYLPGERINERIRRTRGSDGLRYYRTIKAGSGIDRLEVEEETSELFFTTVWPLTRGCRVHKRRYLVPEAELTWEIDEFLDRDGLCRAGAGECGCRRGRPRMVARRDRSRGHRRSEVHKPCARALSDRDAFARIPWRLTCLSGS